MATRPRTTTVTFDTGLRTVVAKTSGQRGMSKLDNCILDPDSRGSIRAIWGLSKVNSTVINAGAACRSIMEALGNDGTVVRLVASSDRIVRVSDAGVVTDLKTGLTNSSHVGMDVLNDVALFCNGIDTPFQATLVSTPVVSDSGVARPDVSGVTTSVISTTMSGVQTALTKLNGGVSALGTTLTVDSTTGYQATGWVYISGANGELVQYTSKTSTTFTLSGTGVVSAHPDNANVHNCIVAVASTAGFSDTGTLALAGSTPEKVSYSSKTDTTFVLDAQGMFSNNANADTVTQVTSGPKGTPSWYVATIVGTTEGALSLPISMSSALAYPTDVTLANVPLGSGGKIALYRTSQSGGQPFLQDYYEGDADSTRSITDDMADRNLGDLPYQHGDPPLVTFTDYLVHMERLFAIQGDKLWWTDLAAHESWWTDTTFGNVAEVFIDDGDVGVALAREQDGVLFFKRNHIYKLAGRTPDDFTIVELTSSDQSRRSLGVPSKNAMAAIPGFGLVFYWNHGLYRCRGGLITYLSGSIENELRAIRRRDEALGVSVGFYPSRRQIMLSVPLSAGANPTHTYIYDMDANQFAGRMTKGFRGFAAMQTDNGDEEFWALSSSDEEGYVYKIEDGTTFAGSAITCEAELPVFFGGQPSALKQFLGVIPNFAPKASGDFDIEIEIDGMTALTQTYTVSQTQASSTHHARMVNIGLNGRRLQVRIKSSADQPAWSIDSLTYVWQDFPGAEYPS